MRQKTASAGRWFEVQYVTRLGPVRRKVQAQSHREAYREGLKLPGCVGVVLSTTTCSPPVGWQEDVPPAA